MQRVGLSSLRGLSGTWGRVSGVRPISSSTPTMGAAEKALLEDHPALSKYKPSAPALKATHFVGEVLIFGTVLLVGVNVFAQLSDKWGPKKQASK